MALEAGPNARALFFSWMRRAHPTPIASAAAAAAYAGRKTNTSKCLQKAGTKGLMCRMHARPPRFSPGNAGLRRRWTSVRVLYVFTLLPSSSFKTNSRSPPTTKPAPTSKTAEAWRSRAAACQMRLSMMRAGLRVVVRISVGMRARGLRRGRRRLIVVSCRILGRGRGRIRRRRRRQRFEGMRGAGRGIWGLVEEGKVLF
ncbi:uncharacterized protein IWZ02DRAFT_104799 [Phyllosticta citriasiana]|uniref:uncharacterized protein n=1 Tax=Phyllosticta citriasiana TaxID=595635 RepID=UPI0030FD9565